jgi:hypothetical protein
MFNDETIINALKALRSIEPDKDFTKKSRLLVLAAPRDDRTSTPVLTGALTAGRTIAVRSLRIVSFSAVALFLCAALYYATAQLSPLFLPGLNQNSIIAEADMVDQKINIEVQQVDHFSAVTKESNRLLDGVTKSTFDHLNTSAIGTETPQIDSISGQADTQLNNQLNSILQQIQ